MKITDEMIKDICSANIYKRGVEYLQEGRVHLRKRADNMLNAVVDGEGMLNLSVKFSDGKIDSYMCTCPYFQTMNSVCKHIVAALKQRQAELEEGEDAADENDKLADILCRGYSAANGPKEELYPSFAMSVVNKNGVPQYYMSISFSAVGTRLQGIEDFLNCYVNKKEYKLDKRYTYEPGKTEFGKYQKEIIDILAESYENKSFVDSIGTKSVYNLQIGERTVTRLMPLLEHVDFSFIIDSINMHKVTMREENPDIVIDVNASDNEIVMEVCERGFAITSNGEWFLYENEIYHTDNTWRRFFMPIYNALNSESKTYIAFRGTNRIGFASEVLPEIKNKRGVVMQGLEDVIVDEKPDFEVYFDAKNGDITAVIIARYGSIPIRLPDDSRTDGKIVVRDYESEGELLAHFRRFEREDGTFILSNDGDIYEFITKDLPILRRNAKVMVSKQFEAISITDATGFKVSAAFSPESRLLEAEFETDLSIEEIKGILAAIRLKQNYYRMKDGRFIDLNECKESRLFSVIEYLDFSDAELKAGRKKLPMYQVLYLESISDVHKTEEFMMLIESIHSIEPVYPEHLKDVLRDYQKEGTAWMKQLSTLGFGGILADDMGLGKTLQVISYVMGERAGKPALIVTPSALTYNWMNEIEHFTPEAKVLVVDGPKDEREKLVEVIDGYDFVITSYPMLRRDSTLYKNKEFAYCFIDEAQYIKNPKTMNARSVKNVNARIKFALTGTPIENSLMELWSIFDFVMSGYLYNAHEFRERFEVPVAKNGDAAAADDLRAKIRPFVLRRMKNDVLEELPEKIENTIYADLVPEQKKLYSAYLAAAKSETEELLESGAKMRILTLLMRLRQICCHPALFDEAYKKESGKLNALIDIVTSAISSGHRVLIFSQFTSMLAIIRRQLDSMDIGSFYIDGQTKPYERTEMAQRFNDGEKNIFLISLKAGGTGLNLIGADTVIHFDPWWNPAVTDQASDRAYRIGQTRAVQVIKLASSGTIEEKILKLQESKRMLADDIIKMNTDSFSSLTNEEILSLFE